MPRKKKEEQEILEEEISQTETEFLENDEPIGVEAADLSENLENESESDTEGDFLPEESAENSVQADNAENESESGETEITADEKVPNDAVESGNSDFQSQSGAEEGDQPGKETSDASVQLKSGKNPVPVRPASGVLSIDGHLVAETDAEKARNDLLDLLESQKTGRILTGTIQGVEQPPGDQSHSFAVIYHGDFKVIIPAEEAVEIPDDLRGREPADVLHYMLTKRLGAEVDYIVKGIDQNAGIAAASRLAAMRARRKEYYMGTDGTEMQVMEPEILEIQLGEEWAGKEFQLKTDTYVYPGTITVGEDGVLRTELGGSKNYILTVLDSGPGNELNLATGEPDGTEAPGAAPENVSSGGNKKADVSKKRSVKTEAPDAIPKKHIILFVAGMTVSVGGLIAIQIVQKKREMEREDEYEDYEDEE